MLISPQVRALDIFGRDQSQGGHGVRDGLVVLYQFTSQDANGAALPANVIRDQSLDPNFVNLLPAQYRTALDLQISDTARAAKLYEPIFDTVTGVARNVNYLDISLDKVVARSTQPASKIVNYCRSTNELTVEMWLRNDFDSDPRIKNVLPLKMLTLGARMAGIQSSADTLFYLGYQYNNAAEYAAGVRARPYSTQNQQVGPQGSRTAILTDNSHVELRTNDEQNNRILEREKYQHVIFTRNEAGDFKLYVGAADLKPNNPVPIRREVLPGGTTPGDFSAWSRTVTVNNTQVNVPYHLAIGNETNFDPRAPTFNLSPTAATNADWRDWRGQVYLVAVYCKAHTEKQILGELAAGGQFDAYKPIAGASLTPRHQIAAQLFNRLTGLKIPLSAAIIHGGQGADVRAPASVAKGMVDYINEGRPLDAAMLATYDPNFYNNTIADFAKRMSTRDESVNTTLNDFVATIIGVTRDDINAQQLLTGNFFYSASPKTASVPNNLVRDLLRSNAHYESLESQGYNLADVLVKNEKNNPNSFVDGQKMFTGSAAVDHPDPAGVITSRAFLGAHAVAGTNRRIIEYSFRQFMCSPITAWADSSGPDEWVGKDVDRLPGGDPNKFLNTCRGCHSNMDGFRGAFAKFNFADGFVKYAGLMPEVTDPDDEDQTNMCQTDGVACKMNRNATTYPKGKGVNDDTWRNFANRGANSNFFKWDPTTLQGSGVRAYASMLAKSEAFPRCMAQRAFRAVCKREPASADSTFITTVGREFASDGYNLRKLFARVVTSRECLGNVPGLN